MSSGEGMIFAVPRITEHVGVNRAWESLRKFHRQTRLIQRTQLTTPGIAEVTQRGGSVEGG